jgi:hypothetical protein
MLLSIKYNYFDKGKTQNEKERKIIDWILFSGPLGLTISGSEDVFEPIVVSDLCEGGLADK